MSKSINFGGYQPSGAPGTVVQRCGFRFNIHLLYRPNIRGQAGTWACAEISFIISFRKIWSQMWIPVSFATSIRIAYFDWLFGGTGNFPNTRVNEFPNQWLTNTCFPRSKSIRLSYSSPREQILSAPHNPRVETRGYKTVAPLALGFLVRYAWRMEQNPVLFRILYPPFHLKSCQSFWARLDLFHQTPHGGSIKF